MLKSRLFEDIRSRHQNLRTSFSMDDSGLRFILEQLSKKGFQRILEFGSGLSTVYMAEIIKCLSLNT
jgi:predicted O-methyltransferase YrrM